MFCFETFFENFYELFKIANFKFNFDFWPLNIYITLSKMLFIRQYLMTRKHGIVDKTF